MVCLLLYQETEQINGRGFMYLYRPWDNETMSGFSNFLKTKTPRISRRQLWIGLATTAAVLIVVIVAYVRIFVDEPLRRTVEHNVNQRLKGYTARIGVLHFHPLRLSLDSKTPLLFKMLIQNLQWLIFRCYMRGCIGERFCMVVS
jgi:hypothetical protein